MPDPVADLIKQSLPFKIWGIESCWTLVISFTFNRFCKHEIRWGCKEPSSLNDFWENNSSLIGFTFFLKQLRKCVKRRCLKKASVQNTYNLISWFSGDFVNNDDIKGRDCDDGLFFSDILPIN